MVELLPLLPKNMWLAQDFYSEEVFLSRMGVSKRSLKDTPNKYEIRTNCIVYKSHPYLLLTISIF